VQCEIISTYLPCAGEGCEPARGIPEARTKQLFSDLPYDIITTIFRTITSNAGPPRSYTPRPCHYRLQEEATCRSRSDHWYVDIPELRLFFLCTLSATANPHCDAQAKSFDETPTRVAGSGCSGQRPPRRIPILTFKPPTYLADKRLYL
jgi:hypothetical protein